MKSIFAATFAVAALGVLASPASAAGVPGVPDAPNCVGNINSYNAAVLGFNTGVLQKQFGVVPGDWQFYLRTICSMVNEQ